MMSKNKKEIDCVRDAAFQLNIQDTGDTSEIENLYSMDNNLYIQTKQGVYHTQHADDIDPDRTNINVPNSIQKIIHFDDKYYETEWVFRTAHELFQNEDGLKEGINKDDVFRLCFSMAKDFSSIQNAVKRIIANEKIAEKEFYEKFEKSNDLIIPYSDDHEGVLTTFLYKASHIHRDLFEILKICFPDITGKKKMYDGFYIYMKNKFGEEDDFTRFTKDSLYQLNAIKNARNCYEHPKEGQRLVVRNYCRTNIDEIMLPSFKIDHRKTPHDFSGISAFIERMMGNLASIVEGFLVMSCVHNPRDFGAFKYYVAGNQELFNQYRFPRYSWTLMPKAEHAHRFGLKVVNPDKKDKA